MFRFSRPAFFDVVISIFVLSCVTSRSENHLESNEVSIVLLVLLFHGAPRKMVGNN